MTSELSGKEEVARVLKIDSECRQKDEEGIRKREEDIFDIASISPKVWDHTLPVGVTAIDTDSYRFSVNNNKNMLTSYMEKYPIIKGIDMSGILIAGGSVLSVLGRRSNHLYGKHDIDLFLCGFDTIEDMENRIKRFTEDISKNIYKGKFRFSVIRSENAITITDYSKFNGSKIQFILRKYDTPSQVLHGFDIGSCAVGIWKGKFITTTLGKFALEYSLNIFDLSRRSLSYEFRIFNKYGKRGFGVIMKHMDLDLFSENKEECINNFLFCRYKIENYQKMKFEYILKNSFPVNDYCPYVMDYMDQIHSHNIKRFLIAQETGEEPKNLIYGKICLNSEDLIKSVVCNKFLLPNNETIGTVVSFKQYFLDNKFYVSRFKRYFSKVGEIEDVFSRIISITDKNELADLSSKHEKIAIDSIIELIDKYDKDGYIYIPTKWRLDNPESQLTGSFHPAVISEKEWYGKYYKD